ncbi:hypothetical protein [Nocardioides sp.]|uniref:hypothetical protein n=1 Tax=Nocardioides sp. TaxID=35761 RepID=UPI002737780D|nr:hypothetical protein [Nocardioides sp.]MDP3891213.1 hypothetical protein [Nocardioides sp.]
MAAEAATTLVGLVVSTGTARKRDRAKATSCCRWTPGVPWGLRLIFWPDVADEPAAAVVRARKAAEARRRRADRETLDAAETAAADPRIGA